MPDETGTTYAAKVMEVFSADDLMLMVDLGVEGLHKKQRFRLYKIDTPNAIHAAAGTEAGQLRSYIRNLTRDRQATILVKSRVGVSWIGVITVDIDGHTLNLNDDLAAKGYAFK